MQKRVSDLILCFVLLFSLPLPAFAANQVNTIDIQAVIYEDGSMHITQSWEGRFDEGTESYIPMNAPDYLTISTLTVSDQNGSCLESEKNHHIHVERMGSMTYACEDCGFLFCRAGEVKECPSCKKILSMFLVLSMVLTMLPISTMAKEAHRLIGTSGEIIEFAPLAQTEKSVTTGTYIQDLKLPETLTATVRTAVITGEKPVQDSGSADD